MPRIAVLSAVALVSVALMSCGESDSTTAAKTGPSTVKIEADPNATFTYTTTRELAKAGKVTIDFKNPQSFVHDVNVANSKGEVVGETQTIIDDSTSLELELKPGKYVYYCNVPGHRKAGMEGTLTVE